MNGRQLIEKIVQILIKEDIRCYDSAIVAYLSKLTNAQLKEIIKEEVE